MKAGDTMAPYPGREAGMTFISFLIVIGLIGFFAMLVLKIGPVYLDHYKVKASLESLKSDRDLDTRSREEIVKSLEKRWEVDTVNSVTRDDVVIDKNNSQMSIRIAYDVATPIMGNVDVLIHFNDAIEVGTR
jgi:hypothetical protein